MNELATTPPSNIVAKEGGNIAVTALLPEEMTGCLSAMVAWSEYKITEVQSEVDELRGAEAHARAQKWKTATLHRHLLLAEKRVIYYGKILLALQNGYVIVPNFPVQLFAIRTAKEGPKYAVTKNRWNIDFKQDSQSLPVGDGEYRNPFPLVDFETYAKPIPTDPNATETRYFPSEWDDLEFPVSMAKPQIMEAATRAMALQVFDQLGILPNARKEDPILVAQMKDPRDKFGQKLVTFFVAWHLDTRVL